MKNIFTSIVRRKPLLLPNFLGIGAQRAGTSWLYEILRRHPDVYVPEVKELHFFDEQRDFGGYTGIGEPDQRVCYDMTSVSHWNGYLRHFTKANGCTAIGEITPSYATISAQRAAVIAEKIPGVKIVYILRNPVQRTWSAFRRLWFGQKGNRDFTCTTDIILRSTMHPAKLIHSDYRRNIGVYETAFAQDRILYLFYDDIVHHPQDVIDRVCKFFGVETLQLPAADYSEKINAAPALPLPEPVKNVLEEYFANQIAFLSTKFGRTLLY
jgi:hypothetical protein